MLSYCPSSGEVLGYELIDRHLHWQGFSFYMYTFLKLYHVYPMNREGSTKHHKDIYNLI